MSYEEEDTSGGYPAAGAHSNAPSQNILASSWKLSVYVYVCVCVCILYIYKASIRAIHEATIIERDMKRL